MQIRDFIPPIVSRAVRRGASQPSLKQYASYEQALEHSDTYEAASIVEVVSRKTQALRARLLSEGSRLIDNPQTLQNVFVTSYVEPHRPLRVFELGGACGASYFELSHLLPERFAEWRIVETPAMSAAGRKHFEGGPLKFFADRNDAVAEMPSRDLLIAQGVVQYTPDPLQTLEDLFSLSFRHVYLSRTPVVEADSLKLPLIFNAESDLSAHGHGKLPEEIVNRKITTPCTIVSKTALVERVPENYRPQFWFDEINPQPILIGSQKVMLRNIGCLFTRLSK